MGRWHKLSTVKDSQAEVVVMHTVCDFQKKIVGEVRLRGDNSAPDDTKVDKPVRHVRFVSDCGPSLLEPPAREQGEDNTCQHDGSGELHPL